MRAGNRELSARNAQLLLGLGGAADELGADAVGIEGDALGGGVAHDLGDELVVGVVAQLALDELAGVTLGGGAREAHVLGGPEPQQLGAPRLGLEGQFLVALEFLLVALLALVEAGHRHTPLQSWAARSAGDGLRGSLYRACSRTSRESACAPSSCCAVPVTPGR